MILRLYWVAFSRNLVVSGRGWSLDGDPVTITCTHINLRDIQQSENLVERWLRGLGLQDRRFALEWGYQYAWAWSGRFDSTRTISILWCAFLELNVLIPFIVPENSRKMTPTPPLATSILSAHSAEGHYRVICEMFCGPCRQPKCALITSEWFLVCICACVSSGLDRLKLDCSSSMLIHARIVSNAAKLPSGPMPNRVQRKNQLRLLQIICRAGLTRRKAWFCLWWPIGEVFKFH